MRDYNSETDFPILAEAVRAAGKAGGFLTAAKTALTAAGINWPPNFNASHTPAAIAIDLDCIRALEPICERHGKPIDPQSGRPGHVNRPGYCSQCNTGHSDPRD